MSVSTVNTIWKVMLETPNAKVTGVHESLLQEAEKDVLWYRDNFLGRGIIHLIQHKEIFWSLIRLAGPWQYPLSAMVRITRLWLGPIRDVTD